jgi:hypothetical protein
MAIGLRIQSSRVRRKFTSEGQATQAICGRNLLPTFALRVVLPPRQPLRAWLAAQPQKPAYQRDWSDHAIHQKNLRRQHANHPFR